MDAQDWDDFYQERSAIKEYDAGLPRAIAEREAYYEMEQMKFNGYPKVAGIKIGSSKTGISDNNKYNPKEKSGQE